MELDNIVYQRSHRLKDMTIVQIVVTEEVNGYVIWKRVIHEMDAGSYSLVRFFSSLKSREDALEYAIQEWERLL